MNILKYLLPPDVNVGRIYQSLLPYHRIMFILRDTFRESLALKIDNKVLSKLIIKN
ncbi:hypothetical protein [Legionella gresilensis]|uniref:hypothetical protein n=1 Tax=Legionella gresilensis TaxID=91823 RepID=UPI0013EFBE95|nr:hypothetical protein [Legionella gresilensis]